MTTVVQVAFSHTHRHRMHPPPVGRSVYTWTSKAWDEVSYNPVSHGWISQKRLKLG